MAFANTILKKTLDVNNMVVEDAEIFFDDDGVKHLRIQARPNRWHEDDCPICHKRCPCYDRQSNHPKIWRGLDWGGTIVEVESYTHRICCPEHGVRVAEIPWAYPGSNFTREFDLTVGWMATCLPRSAISEYMRIDWATVGRCVNRTLAEIEPERSKRLDGLVRIGIDETSYKKGHSYITVIINHDTNTVVWAAPGHGKSVLEQFYKRLTPGQRASIKVVTGDGARWITDCVNEYTPDCERCIDPFHVVEWATQCLDDVRVESWRAAYQQATQLAKEHPPKRGRIKADDEDAHIVKATKETAKEIKNSAMALGKAPENLTEKQQLRMEMIAKEDPRLYRAYKLKEELRLLLKIRDPDEAEEALNRWLWRASHSRIPAFHELYLKVKRHKGSILNAIRLGMNNARTEAVNNKIKLTIRKAYGFRNIGNMLDMIYLVCSNLKVPLPNRKLTKKSKATKAA